MCSAILATPSAGADGVPEGVPEGVYTYTESGAPPLQWTAMPVCTPTVGDLREPLLLPEGCVVNVFTTQDPIVAARSIADGTVPVPGGTARLTGGQWVYKTTRGEAKVCPDGTLTSATDTVSVDPATMTGVRTTTWTARCGRQPGMTKQPFTLTYVGPDRVPVNRQPLQCDPGGLRQCS